jgi:hypothetical protein
MMTTSMFVRAYASLAVAIAAVGFGQQRAVQAAPITPGNLVIYRAGSGTNSLTNTGNNVFLDEYTTAGSLVQSIVITATGTGTKLVSAGLSTSEGPLSISADGRWIGFSGYNNTVGGATTMTTAASSVIPRTAGILDTTTGNFTLTVMGTWFSAASPRSVVTTDGNKLWAVGGNSGVLYGTVDGSSGAFANSAMTNTGTNLRVLGLYGNNLYVSAATGTWPTVGLLAGNPLVNGTTASNTFLPNIPRQGGTPNTSRYGFTFLDTNPAVAGIDTMYTVDDSATSGGLWKYTLDSSGTWNAAGSVTALTGALRGLTGAVDGSSVQLYMTGSGNTLWKYTDTTAATSVLSGTLSAFTSIAIASGSTAFRGVALVPVPEPSTYAMALAGLAYGGYSLFRRRRAGYVEP